MLCTEGVKIMVPRTFMGLQRILAEQETLHYLSTAGYSEKRVERRSLHRVDSA